jgi:hypothetical protein
MKKIDPHGTALDLLHDERDYLESGLRVLKPQIKRLNQIRQTGSTEYLETAEFLFGGTMGELTKLSNELRRRLNSVEETRKLLKHDRALKQEGAWEDEQYRLEGEKLLADKEPYLECGCW